MMQEPNMRIIIWGQPTIYLQIMEEIVSLYPKALSDILP